MTSIRVEAGGNGNERPEAAIFRLGGKALQAKLFLGTISHEVARQIALEQADFDEEGAQSPE